MSKYDMETRQIVIERDKKRCVLCKKPYNDIHEIIPRNQFGNKKKNELFDPQNRVCLCRDCHSTAHTRNVRKILQQYIKGIYK